MFQAIPSSPPDQAPGAPALVSRRTMVVLVLVCLVAGLKTAFDFYLKSAGLIDYVMTDIDTFWLVGWLYWDGRLGDAYGAATLFAAQMDVLQTQSFMPYTYPPQFNFVTAALGMMPVWLSYLVFVCATLALYMRAVQRISPAHLGTVFVLILPAILVNIRTGQNGFLVAGLVALAAQGVLTNGLRGGVALGLAAIKPHVAIGIGAAAVLTGRWRIAALSIATCLVTLAAATAVFGVDLFPKVIAASHEAMAFLRAGDYPLYRMVSVYAFSRTFGASADLALLIQSASAAMVCVVLLIMALRRAEARLIIAAALISPLFISPYAYDYDMTLAGVALALVVPQLLTRCKSWEMLALLGLTWVATGWGIAMSLLTELNDVQATMPDLSRYPSLQAPLNLVLILAIARILRRPAPMDERAMA